MPESVPVTQEPACKVRDGCDCHLEWGFPFLFSIKAEVRWGNRKSFTWEALLFCFIDKYTKEFICVCTQWARTSDFLGGEHMGEEKGGRISQFYYSHSEINGDSLLEVF